MLKENLQHDQHIDAVDSDSSPASQGKKRGRIILVKRGR